MLSGYLVSSSWFADPHFGRFVAKRFLRIWPPLAVVVVFTGLVLGPFVSVLPWSSYFRDPDSWLYLLRNLAILPKHDLPGVFVSNPEPGVNGSLWTLPVEVACYALVPVIFLSRGGPWLLGVISLLCVAMVPPGFEFAGFGLSGAAGLLPFFAAGVLLFVSGVALPRGRRLPADLSFGLYLTSFPIGQTIVSFVPAITPASLMLWTAVIAVPIAALVHYCVEVPVARFRPARARPVGQSAMKTCERAEAATRWNRP